MERYRRGGGAARACRMVRKTSFTAVSRARSFMAFVTVAAASLAVAPAAVPPAAATLAVVGPGTGPPAAERSTRLQELGGVAPAVDVRAEVGADRGSELWRTGDRDGAVAAWRVALGEAQAEGAPSAERARLAYNLGVTEAARGEPMRSVAWFEAALRASPSMADARFNLGLARAEAGLGPRTGDGLLESVEAAARTLTPGESEWMAFLGALLFAGAGLLEALRGGRWARRLLLLVAAAQPVLFAPLALHLSERGAAPFMVIDPAGVQLRAAPEDGAERVGSLPAGAVVSYLDTFPGWTKIRVQGEARWVPSEALFELRL